MDYDIPASQRDRQLPMIVNFRGDEELVDEFNWDAEHVMEFLGIKRSRLTQISGKELRVGRIRRDRYLRPIYREADVRDYQEWTRATATHQSSSRAIEQAIDSLDDRFSDLIVILQEKLVQFEDRTAAHMSQEAQRLDKHGFEHFQQLQAGSEEVQISAERVLSVQEKSQRQMETQTQILATWQNEFAALRGFLANFHQDMRVLAVAQQSLKRDFEGVQQVVIEQLQLQNQTLRESLLSLQDSIAQLAAGQQIILEQTKEKEAVQRIPERKRVRRLPIKPNGYASESAESSPQSNP